MRGRFGRLALVVVGALLATISLAWLVRRREAADAIRQSYETSWERIRVARERLGGRVQERRPRDEMRNIIRESVRRSRGEA